nr:hypothetical protein [Tanacetum cinerariifolium]
MPLVDNTITTQMPSTRHYSRDALEKMAALVDEIAMMVDVFCSSAVVFEAISPTVIMPPPTNKQLVTMPPPNNHGPEIHPPKHDKPMAKSFTISTSSINKIKNVVSPQTQVLLPPGHACHPPNFVFLEPEFEPPWKLCYIGMMLVVELKSIISYTVPVLKIYCRGKENGVNILKSIDEGPYQIRTVRETLVESTEGAPQFGPKRPRVYSDLSPEEKDRYNADIRAKNILLQGLPKDIYTLMNYYTDAKDIWDNVKMLLEGSELTKEDRESQLNIKMTMFRMQLNSKFVNNMVPEWGRFVTAVKLSRGLRDSNYDQLYAYLKQHETHAKENKMMLEQFS